MVLVSFTRIIFFLSDHFIILYIRISNYYKNSLLFWKKNTFDHYA